MGTTDDDLAMLDLLLELIPPEFVGVGDHRDVVATHSMEG